MGVTRQPPDGVNLYNDLSSRIRVLEQLATRIPKWLPLTPYYGTNITAYNATGGQYNDPSFRLVGDVVELKGLLQATGTITSNALLFTLPSGYRPRQEWLVNVPGPAGYNRLDILTTGQAFLYSGLATGNFVSIDGIRFSTT